jgi:hypothetical protein
MREVVHNPVHGGAHDVVDNEEVRGKHECGGDHDPSGRKHLLAVGPRHAAHLCLHFIDVRFRLLRPTQGLARVHINYLSRGIIANTQFLSARFERRPGLAGAEGFEPPLAVLETAGLAVKPMPLCRNLVLELAFSA